MDVIVIAAYNPHQNILYPTNCYRYYAHQGVYFDEEKELIRIGDRYVGKGKISDETLNMIKGLKEFLVVNVFPKELARKLCDELNHIKWNPGLKDPKLTFELEETMGGYLIRIKTNSQKTIDEYLQ